jgi:hypothetical protein
MEYNKSDSDLQVLCRRFHNIKARCGSRRSKTYHLVQFGFPSARAGALYCFETLGPLSPEATIDRINPKLGYEPGNLQYLTMPEQLARRRFRTREQFQLRLDTLPLDRLPLFPASRRGNLSRNSSASSFRMLGASRMPRPFSNMMRGEDGLAH